MNNYIHPNFCPNDSKEYLRVVGIVRSIASDPRVKKVVVSQHSYDVLEDAVHETMKGKGHVCYGKEIVVSTPWMK